MLYIYIKNIYIAKIVQVFLIFYLDKKYLETDDRMFRLIILLELNFRYFKHLTK